MPRTSLDWLLRQPIEQVSARSMTDRRRLAASTRTSILVLDLLWRDPDARVRAALVRNGRLVKMAVEFAANDPHPLVRMAVARRRGVESHVLTRLSADASPEVRHVLARRRGLPWVVLERLVADPEPRVRVTAAAGNRLPLTLIVQCARSPVIAQRQIAAASADLPPALQLALAQDPLWAVRRVLLCHHRQAEVLALLAPEPQVADDDFVSRRLLACLHAEVERLGVAGLPKGLIVALMRSASPSLKAEGRRLALAAHVARTGCAASGPPPAQPRTSARASPQRNTCRMCDRMPTWPRSSDSTPPLSSSLAGPWQSTASTAWYSAGRCRTRHLKQRFTQRSSPRPGSHKEAEVRRSRPYPWRSQCARGRSGAPYCSSCCPSPSPLRAQMRKGSPAPRRPPPRHPSRSFRKL